MKLIEKKVLVNSSIILFTIYTFFYIPFLQPVVDQAILRQEKFLTSVACERIFFIPNKLKYHTTLSLPGYLEEDFRTTANLMDSSENGKLEVAENNPHNIVAKYSTKSNETLFYVAEGKVENTFTKYYCKFKPDGEIVGISYDSNRSYVTFDADRNLLKKLVK